MIAKSTVLILGAGASADYSFPTARQLLLKICEEANPPGPLFQFLTYNMDISASVKPLDRRFKLRTLNPLISSLRIVLNLKRSASWQLPQRSFPTRSMKLFSRSVSQAGMKLSFS